MKKIITLLVAAAMTAVLFAGFAAADETDVSGVWYLHSIEQNGVTLDGGLAQSIGMNITITLNEDGTAILDMNGQATEGTWTKEEGIKVGEQTITMEVVDGLLKVDNNGAAMLLSREAPEAVSVELAPVVEQPELSDFNGTWNVTNYVMMGLPFPLKLNGEDLSLGIQDGQVAYTETIYDMNDNFSVTDTIEHTFEAKLQDDGTLFVDFAGEEVLAKIVAGATGITLTLHEDGKISGEIPELTEMMKTLEAMSAESQNTQAEAAESAEPAETAETGESAGEEVPAEGTSSGASDGSSSGGGSMTSYFLFEKAE